MIRSNDVLIQANENFEINQLHIDNNDIGTERKFKEDIIYIKPNMEDNPSL